MNPHLADFENRSVKPEDIQSGGPPRDGIPAIDSPAFVSGSDAGEWLADVEPVIALQSGGHARAYSLQIMIFHEIVNDVAGDLPVLVTFCPLCNASIVFQRTIGGQVLDFGTTGRLRNSDHIMYDRQSESWREQFTGKGIIGQNNGVRLEPLPSQIVSFQDFANAFPDGQVLSRETVHQRSYGQNPYRGYDDIKSNPFLFDGDLDPRLPPMERVLSVGMKRNTQLIPLTALTDRPVVNVQINNQLVAVFATATAASALDQSSIRDSRNIPAAAAFSRKSGNRTLSFDWQKGRIRDDQTGSQWNPFGLATQGPLAVPNWNRRTLAFTSHLHDLPSIPRLRSSRCPDKYGESGYQVSLGASVRACTFRAGRTRRHINVLHHSASFAACRNRAPGTTAPATRQYSLQRHCHGPCPA